MNIKEALIPWHDLEGRKWGAVTRWREGLKDKTRRRRREVENVAHAQLCRLPLL